jgi:hypothetical protein
MAKQAGLPADPPFDTTGMMAKPGFKVLHVQDIDYRSNCEPFANCLTIVRNWSKAHPDHLPIFLLIENKDGKPALPNGAIPEPLTTQTFEALDAEVLSVFHRDELITQDDVRGTHKTLNEAITTDGWPTLEKARGKVIFLLDQRRVTPLYKGHIFFPNAEPGTPESAFTECNDSATNPDLVPGLIKQGYLVRTMTDPGAAGVKANATEKRDKSIASGAQILSTDYPIHEPAESGYQVEVDHGTTRCNPVLKPASCTQDKVKP